MDHLCGEVDGDRDLGLEELCIERSPRNCASGETRLHPMMVIVAARKMATKLRLLCACGPKHASSASKEMATERALLCIKRYPQNVASEGTRLHPVMVMLPTKEIVGGGCDFETVTLMVVRRGSDPEPARR